MTGFNISLINNMIKAEIESNMLIAHIKQSAPVARPRP